MNFSYRILTARGHILLKFYIFQYPLRGTSLSHLHRTALTDFPALLTPAPSDPDSFRLPYQCPWHTDPGSVLPY